MPKGSVGLRIIRIGRVITIWEKIFFEIIVSFDVMIIRNKVLSESSHRIETNLDAVVEVLEFQNSIAFELCFDKEFIEFW